MNDEIEKTILRIIQDYCYKNNIQNLVNEFSLTVTATIAKLYIRNNLTHENFKSACARRRDFFYANDLDTNIFIINLYRSIKKELSYYVFNSLQESLLEYKKRLENGNVKGFPSGTKEDTLRSNLSVYLRFENFCEPRCGTGNCDIIIPSQHAIIETKLWHGIEYFNSGLPELAEYLIRQNYSQGYYIVYDYSLKDNEVIRNEGESFQVSLSNVHINVIFIRMNRIAPSKIYKTKKNLI